MTTAPLRQIVKRNRPVPPAKVSTHGRMINIRWKYEVELTLECGHVVVRNDYGAPRHQVRCKACLAATGE